MVCTQPLVCAAYQASIPIVRAVLVSLATAVLLLEPVGCIPDAAAAVLCSCFVVYLTIPLRFVVRFSGGARKYCPPNRCYSLKLLIKVSNGPNPLQNGQNRPTVVGISPQGFKAPWNRSWLEGKPTRRFSFMSLKIRSSKVD